MTARATEYATGILYGAGLRGAGLQGTVRSAAFEDSP